MGSNFWKSFPAKSSYITGKLPGNLSTAQSEHVDGHVDVRHEDEGDANEKRESIMAREGEKAVHHRHAVRLKGALPCPRPAREF